MPASIDKLSQELVGMLRAPVGFRNNERAGMLLVHLAEPGKSDEDRQSFVARVIDVLGRLPSVEQRNVAHGLAEIREVLFERPSVRTMVAMSVWEQLVSCLPEEHQYLAREGELT